MRSRSGLAAAAALLALFGACSAKAEDGAHPALYPMIAAPANAAGAARASMRFESRNQLCTGRSYCVNASDPESARKILGALLASMGTLRAHQTGRVNVALQAR